MQLPFVAGKHEQQRVRTQAHCREASVEGKLLGQSVAPFGAPVKLQEEGA